jgi:hypothetical protein
MEASELRPRARQEADELGPQASGAEAESWREERWGAVVLLAGLADDNADLLRDAANGVAAEWADREAPACYSTRRSARDRSRRGRLSWLAWPRRSARCRAHL